MAQLMHVRRLILIFAAWKIALLLLATLTPGPGYDTSSLILLDKSTNRHFNAQSSPVLGRLPLRTFRWDALYFVNSAQRGYLYEQEWAFSWTYSYIINSVARCERLMVP